MDLFFVVPAFITRVFDPIEELAMPIKISIKEAKNIQ